MKCEGAANEWVQTTASGEPNPNQIYWDAAGNMLGNNGFGGASPAQTITDTKQNVIPMSYTGPGQAERVSAGWAASNPDTPWGNTTTTYGSGMLSQTNSAGSEQGTIHYTRDPYGTLIAQRVPGAASNYDYLPDAEGSVLRMVDGGGNALVSYDYCPTGNAPGDLVMTTIAQNNPYRYLGMYDDPGSQMYYDGYSIDSNSGIAIQLCPLPFGGTSLPCLAPMPLFSQGQGKGKKLAEGCPGTSDDFFADEINGYYVQGRGPQGGPTNCHINVEVQYVFNDHITYVGDEFVANGTTPLGTGALQVSYDLTGLVVESTGAKAEGDLWDLYTKFQPDLEQALSTLQGYYIR